MTEPRWEWSAEEIRRVGHQVVDLIAEHLSDIAERPVVQPVPAGAFGTASAPDSGRSAAAVLAEFERTVLPYPFGNGHPRFWGWVNSPPHVLGVFAEALAAAMNPSVAGGNHAAVHLERQVVRWFCDLAGLPASAFGLLTSGGSSATLTALAAARQRALPEVRTDGVAAEQVAVYLGDETHSCARKAVELLGIGSRQIRSIPADAAYRMRPDLLDAAICRDLAAGVHPVAVVASVGTVNTGAVDPLGDIADVCAEHGVWLHVDGAYGAPPVLLLERFRDTRDALARVDSLALDPHKWLYVPVDAGLVLFRNGERARDAFSLVPPYLRTEGDEPWFSEYGFEQTRPFRALKVWMQLRYFGLDGYRALIAHDLDLADRLRRRIEASSDFEVLAHGLSVCCFRANSGAADLDQLNRALLARLQSGGRAFLTGTTVSGVFALRACIINPGSTDDDIAAVVTEISRTLADLRGND